MGRRSSDTLNENAKKGEKKEGRGKGRIMHKKRRKEGREETGRNCRQRKKKGDIIQEFLVDLHPTV